MGRRAREVAAFLYGASGMKVKNEKAAEAGRQTHASAA